MARLNSGNKNRCHFFVGFFSYPKIGIDYEIHGIQPSDGEKKNKRMRSSDKCLAHSSRTSRKVSVFFILIMISNVALIYNCHPFSRTETHIKGTQCKLSQPESNLTITINDQSPTSSQKSQTNPESQTNWDSQINRDSQNKPVSQTERDTFSVSDGETEKEMSKFVAK